LERRNVIRMAGLYLVGLWLIVQIAEFLRKTSISACWDELGAPEHCRKDAGGDYRCLG
jgi:hypothetical protein